VENEKPNTSESMTTTVYTIVLGSSCLLVYVMYLTGKVLREGNPILREAKRLGVRL
jgi:hypothetical protein